MIAVREQAEAFIEYKQAIGIGMNTAASALRNLAEFAESIGHTGPVDVELACAWATSGTGHARGYEVYRYEEARRMSEFARAFDDTLPVLPAGLLGRVGNRVEPYIYSDEDISLLMYAASQMGSLDPLRPLANKTLIGLLRATGMRPSEAINLKDMNIDENKGTIVVKDSKGKSRILPILESTLTALISYRDLRDQLRNSFSCDNLFISSGGIPLTLDAADESFKEYRHVLLGRGEVWHRRPPRLMDIRHSFCCWTITSWYEQGKDVMALMPILASYLGHVHPAETYWYLTGVPQLMSIACDSFRDMVVGEVFFDEQPD